METTVALRVWASSATAMSARSEETTSEALIQVGAEWGDRERALADGAHDEQL
jgi:hypothetical protein